MVRRARLDERFWGKVNFFGADGCWDWAGYVTPQGYGSIYRGGGIRRPQQAHRVAYELLIGEIPEGLVLDHLCRNRKCVNPLHVEVVTQRINVLRGENQTAKQAKRTRCPEGHRYDRVDTSEGKRRRYCSICSSARSKVRYQANLEENRRRARERARMQRERKKQTIEK
jgi:hypothetical protein